MGSCHWQIRVNHILLIGKSINTHSTSTLGSSHWLEYYWLCYECVNSHTDVGLRLQHQSNQTAFNIRVNSIVRLAALGTLLCTTPYQHCCQNRGQWHYPNRSVVPASQSGSLFFTSRTDRGRLGLQWRTGFQEMYPGVDGVYECQIPDVKGRTQTLYAWIYSGPLCKLLCLCDNHMHLFR